MPTASEPRAVPDYVADERAELLAENARLRDENRELRGKLAIYDANEDARQRATADK